MIGNIGPGYDEEELELWIKNNDICIAYKNYVTGFNISLIPVYQKMFDDLEKTGVTVVVLLTDVAPFLLKIAELLNATEKYIWVGTNRFDFMVLHMTPSMSQGMCFVSMKHKQLINVHERLTLTVK